VSDEKLWDESPTSRHLQVLYHQTSFQDFRYQNQNISDCHVGSFDFFVPLSLIEATKRLPVVRISFAVRICLKSDMIRHSL